MSSVSVPAHPSATPLSYLDRPAGDVWSHLRERGARPYGYGKGAFADALRALDLPAGSNVLLPALVPRRLPEPIRAAGLEPRFYRVRSDLRPDLGDLRERVDGDSAALVAVQYFGFPQPAFDDLAAVAAERGLALVDDSSHGALSERDGRPLGSLGDVGFASLYKLFPVPNGAVLYLGAGVDAPARSPAASLTAADYRYAAASAVESVANRAPVGGRLLRAPVSAATLLSRVAGRSGGSGAEAERNDGDAEADWDVPTSRLTVAALSRTDRSLVISRRRARYREWLELFERVDGAEPVFDGLPRGVCPWAFPVVCRDPVRILRPLRGRVAGAYAWPTLPREVHPRRYPTAERLSRTLVTLPVHQSIGDGRIPRLAGVFGG